MEQKVLLMGTPNVGKSALFNRLTGLNVSVANYSGTTVDYASGIVRQGKNQVRVIDVPGTYSLCATCEAEEVAVKMVCGKNSTNCTRPSSSTCCGEKSSPLSEDDAPPTLLVYVLDAGNFEGGLYLLLQLLELKMPLLVALNRGDLALEKGYSIDIKALTHILGIPIVPTIALSGKGVEELKSKIFAILEFGESIVAVKNNSTAATWDNLEMLTDWLRLPEEAAAPLILGILRRELAVLPLLDLDFSTLPLFTGAVVGLFYVPCIAIVATVAREFKIFFALVILVLTTLIAFFFGGLIARLGSLLLLLT